MIGAAGSAIADLMGGYPYFIPATLMAKALEGGLAGFVGKDLNKSNSPYMQILGGIAGISAMTATYFIAECMMFSIPVALAEIVPNLLQGTVGIAGGMIMLKALKRSVPEAGLDKPENHYNEGIS